MKRKIVLFYVLGSLAAAAVLARDEGRPDVPRQAQADAERLRLCDDLRSQMRQLRADVAGERGRHEAVSGMRSALGCK